METDMTDGVFKPDDLIEELLNHKNNSVAKVGVSVKIIGKGNHGNGGRKTLEESPRKDIRTLEEKTDVSVLANLVGVKAATEILDISQSVVSKKKNGLTSNNDPDPELVEARDNRLGVVKEKALSRVDILLDVITDERIKKDLTVKDAAVTAEKMANVYDKLKKKSDLDDENNRVKQVIFYSPRQVTVNDYRIQEVE